MNEKLRAELEAAIRDTALSTDLEDDDGVLILTHVDALLGAITPVIDGRLWIAHNTLHGKCRYCGALVVEAWAITRELQPHKMNCVHYVGPVEHYDVGGRQSLTHWSTGCSCGRARDKEREPLCPESAEVWKGPQPE